MSDRELLDSMKRLKVQTGSLACLGCAHESNCGIHGCAILRELMSTADAAVFAQDWESARGCRIENMAAILYGLDVLEVYSRGD